ncbi:BQ2448_7016 [Microbotryum intermedium]|uniref:PAN2-PAN3 deadenylation complex subunit PAN3 n=1 Tax=Microbotryum intermedium TaxID=269621 RepID=A0A238FLQ9_9BASI|nr:BQ2448_7016 [Microbotryum intermedium]
MHRIVRFIPGVASPDAAQPPRSESTPLSVDSVAKAAIFVPGAAGSASGGQGNEPATGQQSLAPNAGAQEFVPGKRPTTPALSEDAPYFTPAAQRHHLQNETPVGHLGNNNHSRGSGNGSGMVGPTAHNHHVESPHVVGMHSVVHTPTQSSDHHLADYFAQSMDMNGLGDYNRAGPGGPSAMFGGGAVGAGPSHGSDPQQAMYDYGGHVGPAGSQDAFYVPHQSAMPSFVRQPLQYHLYHPLPSSSTHQQSQQFPSFFLPPSLHIALTSKLEATHATPTVDLKLPEEVGGYIGLYPLDKGMTQSGAGGGGAEGQSGWNGFRSWIYKAWKESDGKAYALRRIEGYRLHHEAAITMVEKWTRLTHPGLVSVREAFTTRAFGDQSIIFVYDYYPTSQTIWESHLSPLSTLPPNPWATPNHNIHQHNHHHAHLSHSSAPLYRGRGAGLVNSASTGGSGGGGGGGGGIGLAERVLWSYIVQIGSVLKFAHSNGLAARTLEVNRLLVTGKNRVRLAGCGVLDVLHFDGGNNLAQQQQEDLLSFGKLIITLACGSPAAVHNLPKSVDHIARVYSPDLKNTVLYLLSKPGPRKTIEEVVALMGTRVMDELNSSLVAEDTLESELLREVENGRLVRLLTKFSFINERPEFDHDPRWAETGDRYIIKLFRDYVFHQVDDQGRPVTDLSHVLTALNKLDAGVDEKLLLVSRDEQSCLIVSYREVKNCIEAAFLDLSRAGGGHHP